MNWIFEPDYKIYWYNIFPTKEEVLKKIEDRKAGKTEPKRNREEVIQRWKYIRELTTKFNNLSLEERLKIINYYKQKGWKININEEYNHKRS